MIKLNKIFKTICYYSMLLFALLFTLDGTVGITHIISSYFVEVPKIAATRNIIAMSSILFSVVASFIFITSNVPKTKAAIFLIAANIVTYFISIFHSYVSSEAIDVYQILFGKLINFTEIYRKNLFLFIFDLAINFGQLMVGFCCFYFIFKERNIFKQENTKIKLWHKAALVSCVPGAAIALLILGGVVSFPPMIENATRGYIEVTMKGIIGVEKIFEKDGRHVHLIPMAHIGEKDFYRNLTKNVAFGTTVYLVEGISDKKRLLKNFNYRNIASKLNLSEQTKHFNPKEKSDKEMKMTSMIKVKSADVDASSFSEDTIKYLKDVNKFMEMKSVKTYSELLAFANDANKKKQLALFYDIVEKRNENLLSIFDKEAPGFQRIIIPWGALHMRDIEKGLIKRGYKLVPKNNKRTIISFVKTTK